MPDPRCLKRVHDWGKSGPTDGAVCVRPGCGKVYGKRPVRGLGGVGAAVSAPGAPALALAPSVPGEAAKRPGGLAGAAARLAAQRGLTAPAAGPIPTAAPPFDGAARDVVAPSESERESLSDWLLPAVPGLVVDGCKWSIRKAGRDPLDPDPVWERRWERSYHQSLGHYVPRLEMHPAVALLVATLFLWLSMFVGAKRLAKEDKSKADKLPAAPAPSSAPSAPGEVQEVAACPTPATAPSPADSPLSVDGSVESETMADLIPSSLPPDASGADGGVTNATRSA